MDMRGGHNMGGMAPPPSPHGGMRKRYVHMTFFWGKNSEILFTGWPGARGGMYALALVAVFAFALLLEFLGSRRLDALLSAAAGRRAAAAGAARTAVYALRVGGAYLLMLALMSFNGGVLLVAVAGHAAGFLAFRAGLFGDRRAQVEGDGKDEVAPVVCC
ncbi:copper transporter 1 [Zea mays]|uniref:Copper transport protein n=1 Tax=Zea mays TaxID=4577 RepID=A0A1D6NAI3_MAIZE|nr:copper transporter 1 [Zea mays]ONM37550.1 Copper transporter 1 [Zea mays]|eukprot:NP_001152680.2 copper transporter 1 [Zea mays]